MWLKYFTRLRRAASVAYCAFADRAANKTYVAVVHGNLNVATILTFDAEEERRFK